jgi:seryl-tRNA synthetase
MIDIDIIRKTPEIVLKDLEKRGDKEKIPWVKKIGELDLKWRKEIQEINSLRKRKNEINKKIIDCKREGKKCTAEIRDSKRIDLKIQEAETRLEELRKDIESYLLKLPNILSESVPVGNDDSDNIPIKYWGTPLVWEGHLGNFKKETGGKIPFKRIDWQPMDHQDIADKWGLLDIKRAAKISGSRFFFMKKELVLLDMAIQKFAMDEMMNEGFEPIEPPFMTKKDAESGVTSMTDFEDVLYKIEGEDLYMIPTSEHPMIAMHMDEVINPGSLPIKYCGVSACFRKEAGSHGRDTKGIFRVHQFNKVEQVVLSKPEDSWVWHERILGYHENIFKKLRIPHRVVNVCTGEMGIVAAKKYDLEAWLPGQGKYREMGSCSNCTEWQSRRLNIRYFEPDGRRRFVHTLNSTAIAQRGVVAVLENNQNKKGEVRLPSVLRKYAGFSKIPSS